MTCSAILTATSNISKVSIPRPRVKTCQPAEAGCARHASHAGGHESERLAAEQGNFLSLMAAGEATEAGSRHYNSSCLLAHCRLLPDTSNLIPIILWASAELGTYGLRMRTACLPWIVQQAFVEFFDNSSA